MSAGKLKTEQKLIVLPCLHSPPYLFSRKICTQSHSAEFLKWGEKLGRSCKLCSRPRCQPPLFRGIFRGKFAGKSADFAGFYRKKSNYEGFSWANSRKNRPISREISGGKVRQETISKKQPISLDFLGGKFSENRSILRRYGRRFLTFF